MMISVAITVTDMGNLLQIRFSKLNKQFCVIMLLFIIIENRMFLGTASEAPHSLVDEFL